MQQVLIDKFKVPAAAKEEFMARLKIRLNFIRTLPGLIETTAFEQTGGDGEFNYVTTAVWESEKALKNARAAVKNEYQKQGFDPTEMFEKLNINMDRAIYRKITTTPESPTKNKETVKRLYKDGLNKRNFELFEELVAEDYVGVQGERGASGFMDTIQSLLDAFPDIRWKIEDSVAEGDKVVIRTSWEGTHTETFRGFLPPSKKRIEDRAITIYQLKNGKIIKAWIMTDRLGFLQQTGAIPEDLSMLVSQNKEE